MGTGVTRASDIVVPNNSPITFVASLLATVADPYIFSGYSFYPIGANAYNVQIGPYLSETNWLRLERRPGDRRPEDPTSVERVGIDGGYYFHLTKGRRYTVRMGFVFLQNCEALTADDYLAYYENHTPFLAGEQGGSGPFIMNVLRSSSANASAIRINRQFLTLDGNGKQVGAPNVQILCNDLPTPLPTERYEFEMDFFEDDTAGIIGVWLTVYSTVDGNVLRARTKLVDYTGQFGYGDLRPMTIQARLYQKSRPNDISVMWVKPREISDVAYTPPTVVYGPDVFDDPTSYAGWTDNSTTKPGFEVVNPGPNGGPRLRLIYNAGANNRPQKSFPTEVGETYEIKTDGNQGVFVGTSAGSNNLLANGGGAGIARTFVATTTTTWLGATSPGSASVESYFENVVIRKKTVTGG